MNKFTTFSILLVALLAVGVGFLASHSRPITTQGSLVAAISDVDHMSGGNTAPVTLVEYSDFQCPACGSYYPVLESLRKDMGDSLRFVYRHFPLTQAHKNAELAAFASEAASAQGKFWEMHALLFENQDTWSISADAKSLFIGYAKSLGLDPVKFEQDISSVATKERVARDVASGVQAGVNGTPSFYVNGKKIENPRSLAEFKTVLSQAQNGSL